MTQKFKNKERVVWTYDHYLPPLHYHRGKQKAGVFIGLCRHSHRHWLKPGSVQMAMVRFDGNKSVSIVPVGSLAREREVLNGVD